MCQAEDDLKWVREHEIPDLQARIDELVELFADVDRGIVSLDEARRAAAVIRDNAKVAL